MTKLLNKVKECKIIPKNWKISMVVPLYKGKGDINKPGNYRGISLLSILGKIYTGIMAERL